MNLSAPVKGFIFSFLAVILAFAIYFFFLAKKNYYLVDNPTPNTYYFKINNGSEQIISAGQSVQVDLSKGKNSIQVFDNNKKIIYDSAFQVNKLRGLLNIAHQDYYVNRQFYGYIPNKDSLLLSHGKTVIDGKDYLGDVTHHNKLYIEDFYYNIDEDYDAVVKNIQKVESRTKLFRKQDFLNYYNEYYKF
ncbi:hypothetical protein PG593_05555 [Riemerella anatipestifer]|uniref:hypothetical protein n=1 Tax=Riemerella anatipestifer TaxID=34085 RepID=UPI002A8624E1|nr:hypothetical protein [Riemerella anatipestifer]MDY3363271.1 hypothetical protein [Riemerella anatipestifer]MDY3529239.1 hypothetical protein [Riemerella anatipestifer]